MNMAWSEADSQLYQGLASIAVPRRAEQMAAILSLLPFGPDDSATIVELCCGEGRLTASALGCFPRVRALARRAQDGDIDNCRTCIPTSRTWSANVSAVHVHEGSQRRKPRPIGDRRGRALGSRCEASSDQALARLNVT